MAIETSDLNDKAILDDTREESNGKGAFRYKITLPDGHPMTSEWIPQDKKSTALILNWLETVRSTAASRSAEREQETLAQARRKKLEEEAAKPLIVPPKEFGSPEWVPPLTAKDLLPSQQPTQDRQYIPNTSMGAAIAQLERQAEQLEAQAKSLRSAAEVLKRT